ncbi:MAG TPA: HlyD family efflux transporter periplasmic adaptor subunit [Thermoanaerobaculia bacterium]|nr:HlyD family efflux transporter periplasmic adaptor subunit [Thermoanaerobaculia bacterium]
MKRLLLCGALAGAVLACARHADVPTYKVAPTTFTRRITAEGNLKAVKATPVMAPHDAPNSLKVSWMVDDGAVVKKNDVIVRFDASDFEKELKGGNEDHATATNDFSKSDAQALATRANLQRDERQAESELLSAKRFKFDDAEVFSRYQRIEAEVDQGLASEHKQNAERVLTIRDGLNRTDKELLAIEDKEAALRIRNAQQGLNSIEIRAPYDGILVLTRDWRGDVPRVGSTLWPGQPLGEIPDLGTMKAEVFVLEADAAGLAPNEKASVTLESRPNVAYSGKITQVDKLARPRVRGVPVQYFGVTITLDKTDPRVMKPGTRVRAVLDVENRANTFAIPRQALFEKDGKKIVYRKHGSKYDAVPVEISSSTAGRVVVTKGIAQGDELALIDPTAKKDEG